MAICTHHLNIPACIPNQVTGSLHSWHPSHGTWPPARAGGYGSNIFRLRQMACHAVLLLTLICVGCGVCISGCHNANPELFVWDHNQLFQSCGQ